MRRYYIIHTIIYDIIYYIITLIDLRRLDYALYHCYAYYGYTLLRGIATLATLRVEARERKVER